MTMTRERWYRLAGFLLVFVLPLLGPLWVIDRLLADRESRSARELETRMEREQFQFLLEGNPREILSRQFGHAFAWLRQKGFAENAFLTMPRFFPAELGMELAGFTPEGKLVVPTWATLTVKFGIRKMWEDMQAQTYDPKRLKMYRTIFGPGFFPWDAWDRQGFPFLIVAEQGDGTLLLKAGPQRSGLLVFIRSHPPERALIKKTLARLREDGFWAVFQPQKRLAVTRGTPFSGWQSLLRAGVLSGPGTYVFGENLCRLSRHAEGFWILRSFPTAGWTTHRQRAGLWMFCLLLLAVGFRFWFRPGLSPVDRLRVAPRLLFFFTLAILLPLVFFLYLGYTAFFQQMQMEEEGLHERNLIRLRDVDAAVRKRREELLEICRRLRDSPLYRGRDAEGMLRHARQLRERRLMGKFETLDGRGKSIAKLEGTEKYTSQVIGLFAKEVLKRYKGAQLPPANAQLETFVMSFLRSPCLDFTNFFDLPDQIRLMSSGRLSSSYWYWDVVDPTPEQPMAFVFFLQYYPVFVQNVVKQTAFPNTFLFNGDLRQWVPRSGLTDRAGVLAFQTQMTRKPGRQIMHFAGKRLLVSAFPSSVLKGFIFLTAADLADVDHRLKATSREIAVIGFLVILLTVLFSRVLSRAFLDPITKIGQGIEALEKRDFQFRIPALGADEFGSLAATLNETIEGMYDLDIGREVQQNLVPKKPPSIQGYEVAFHNESATDLGGDYLDCFPGGPDGKLTYFLTGDVSGHGVASALLMAMAKAVCFMTSREGGSFCTYLSRLNTLLHKVVHKRKLMSLAMGALDPETHRMEWVSLGHPYPLVRRASGEVAFLRMPKFPLGVSGKTSWVPEVCPLGPGDWVVFYTDGLVESLNTKSEFFTFDRLEHLCRSSSAATAADILQEILAAFRAHTSGVPAGDDLTLLIVRRQN